MSDRLLIWCDNGQPLAILETQGYRHGGLSQNAGYEAYPNFGNSPAELDTPRNWLKRIDAPETPADPGPWVLDDGLWRRPTKEDGWRGLGWLWREERNAVPEGMVRTECFKCIRGQHENVYHEIDCDEMEAAEVREWLFALTTHFDDLWTVALAPTLCPGFKRKEKADE